MIKCKDPKTFVVTCNKCGRVCEYLLEDGHLTLYAALLSDGWETVEIYGHVCKECQQTGRTEWELK